MGAQLTADVINDARATDLVLLAESYGVKMHKQGKDFFGCCPFHSEDTPSFTIFRKGNGPQRFQCFGCGASGDPIEFVRGFEGLKFRDAVRRLVGNLPATGNAPTPAAAHVPAEPEEVWTPILPVPDSAPMTPDTIRRKIKGQWASVKASRRWDYRDANGDVLGYVFRFDMPGGGKEVLPLVWAVSSLTGEMQWRWISFPKPRPLYGLDKLAENPNALVILVEGEKAADAAQELFIANGLPMQDLVAVSWPGGGKAVKHVDWSPLAGRAVALWPDADQKPYPANHERAGVTMPFLEQPGTTAMLDVWQAIRETAARVKFILPPANVPDGWDLADPPPPGFDLRQHIKHHTMHADAVERRFSLVTSLAADDTVVPIWFVPAVTPAELRRAAFAAEVVAFSMPDLGGRIDPRGVQLRPFAGIDGLRAALKEARQFLPAAHLRVLLPAELGDEAVEVAEGAGASIEALKVGECWVDNVWRAAGLQEPVGEAGDDEHEDALLGTVEPAAAPERTPDPADHDDDIWNNPNFRILGHKRKSYFFYQCGKRQVLEYAGRELSTTASLIELAPLDWWKQRYPGGSGGIDRDAAFNALVRIAEQRGVYDDTRRRGCGAWWDRGRFVVHLGDRLLVDGLVVPLGAIKSAYVYEAAPLFAEIGDVPLSSEEGGRLLEIAKRFRWEKAVSADLLCGWVFLAPICGALKWRPHVWLTGSAGSGKTTLVADFAHKLIPEGVTVFGNGDSSEAGFRQELDSNARPIMIDESESDDLKARSRVEDVIAMLRQSSSDSGAKTYRGTAGGKSMSFLVRSMAMLSSIGVALKQQQDVERIAVLALKSKRDDDGAAADWPAIKAGLRWIAEDGLISERVFRRAIDMIQTISEAIDRFSEAIADHEAFGTQRHGDQYGTLLAGCWCLTHDRAPSVEEAAGVVAGHDWGEHQAKHGEEPEELMATLLGCPVVLERGVRTSIGVLIAIAAGRPAEDERLGDLTHREANAQLHTYGMKVTAGVLRVHPSNKQLEQLLAGTKFAAGLHERMKRVKGADTWGGRTFRIGEASKNGVHIPIDTVFAASDEEAMASSGAARPLPVPAPF